MPRAILRDEVRRLLENGAQLVEVLSARQYRSEHIAGALSLPLRSLNHETATRLLRMEQPVITYCYDAR